jgi:hypothetical protein
VRRLAIVIGLCGGLAILVAGTALAQYGGALTLNPTSAKPGDAITVTGAGYTSHTTVTVTFESAPVRLATPITHESGAFSAVVRVPSNAAAGVHTIKASGEDPGGGTRVLSASITILGAEDRAVRTITVTLFTLILFVGLVLVARNLVFHRG